MDSIDCGSIPGPFWPRKHQPSCVGNFCFLTFVCFCEIEIKIYLISSHFLLVFLLLTHQSAHSACKPLHGTKILMLKQKLMSGLIDLYMCAPVVCVT